MVRAAADGSVGERVGRPGGGGALRASPGRELPARGGGARPVVGGPGAARRIMPSWSYALSPDIRAIEDQIRGRLAEVERQIESLRLEAETLKRVALSLGEDAPAKPAASRPAQTAPRRAAARASPPRAEPVEIFEPGPAPEPPAEQEPLAQLAPEPPAEQEPLAQLAPEPPAEPAPPARPEPEPQPEREPAPEPGAEPVAEKPEPVVEPPGAARSEPAETGPRHRYRVGGRHRRARSAPPAPDDQPSGEAPAVDPVPDPPRPAAAPEAAAPEPRRAPATAATPEPAPARAGAAEPPRATRASPEPTPATVATPRPDEASSAAPDADRATELRLIALDMALRGKTREQTTAALRELSGWDDVSAILADIYL